MIDDPELALAMERQDRVLRSLAGLSEQEAVATITAAIAARFDGSSLAKIVEDLVALHEWCSPCKPAADATEDVVN